MKKAIFYLLFIAALDVWLLVAARIGIMPEWWTTLGIVVECALIGGIGGAVYCLRGVYLHACVKKNWDTDWQAWYYIRPLLSHITGAVSFIFLKAGLLVLEAQSSADSTDFGFLALAFIAGLNVDKFISKVEDIAQAAWGIEKSRVASGEWKNED